SVRGTSRSEAKVEPTLPLASGFGAAFNTVTPEHKQTSQNTESLTNHRHHVHSVKTTGYDVVVIGASTGGPAALQNVLTKLPAHFPLPILLVQHMPGSFTTVFAERLNQLCNIKVKEAEDGDILYPGCAYLAPGGMQMILDPTNKQRLRVVAGEARLTYKPSVDITFASVARGHAKTTLAVILTGMGADGTEGSRHLIKQGATIWAQDEKTSTIWGMPKSVIKAGLADNELSLNEIGDHLSRCRRA
ncbi:MAG: chemotaxis protein CheB, partial [Pontibacterium sp.]